LFRLEHLRDAMPGFDERPTAEEAGPISSHLVSFLGRDPRTRLVAGIVCVAAGGLFTVFLWNRGFIGRLPLFAVAIGVPLAIGGFIGLIREARFREYRQEIRSREGEILETMIAARRGGGSLVRCLIDQGVRDLETRAELIEIFENRWKGRPEAAAPPPPPRQPPAVVGRAAPPGAADRSARPAVRGRAVRRKAVAPAPEGLVTETDGRVATLLAFAAGAAILFATFAFGFRHLGLKGGAPEILFGASVLAAILLPVAALLAKILSSAAGKGSYRIYLVATSAVIAVVVGGLMVFVWN